MRSTRTWWSSQAGRSGRCPENTRRAAPLRSYFSRPYWPDGRVAALRGQKQASGALARRSGGIGGSPRGRSNTFNDAGGFIVPAVLRGAAWLPGCSDFACTAAGAELQRTFLPCFLPKANPAARFRSIFTSAIPRGRSATGSDAGCFTLSMIGQWAAFGETSVSKLQQAGLSWQWQKAWRVRPTPQPKQRTIQSAFHFHTHAARCTV